MKKTIYQNIVRSLNNIISLALDENLNERLEKMGDCFCTTSAYDIVNLLKNKPKEYRILYDKNINTYMIGDADSITHWDMLQEAKRNALYYSQEDFINSLGDFQNYVDLGQDGGWDENDNEIEPFLYYIVFSPNEEWKLGTDGYNKRYDYPFGHVFTRGCDLSEIDLWDALGVPENSEKINESADNLNDAFWKWFGKSKMVNSDGTPKRFYHVTHSDFNEFKPTVWDKKQGFIPDEEKGRKQYYFTQHKDWADNFGKQDFSKKQQKSQNVIEVFLKIENPLICIDINRHPIQWWVDFFQKNGVNFTETELEQISRYGKGMAYVSWEVIFNDTHILSDKLKEAGYDGFIIGDTKRDSKYSASVIVFDSNQIKSVDNNGNWSNSDNIYEALNKELEKYL